jgi:hypothetical protein
LYGFLRIDYCGEGSAGAGIDEMPGFVKLVGGGGTIGGRSGAGCVVTTRLLVDPAPVFCGPDRLLEEALVFSGVMFGAAGLAPELKLAGMLGELGNELVKALLEVAVEKPPEPVLDVVRKPPVEDGEAGLGGGGKPCLATLLPPGVVLLARRELLPVSQPARSVHATKVMPAPNPSFRAICASPHSGL